MHNKNRVNVGLVGIGFMGWIHSLAYGRSQVADLVAFASKDPKKRGGDWRGIQGNFGPPGEQISLEGLEVAETLEALVRLPQIDVIDICLPPHLHVDAACYAMEHGKDVFIEKPVALTLEGCHRIQETSRKTGQLALVAHVLPYMGPFAYATELVSSGKYGPAIGGYFKRVISDPTWIPDFYQADKVGGPLVDLHVHDLHWIQLLFGKPTRTHAVGRLHGSVAKYVHVLYEFESPDIAVSSSSGVIDGPGRPFTHGFELHLRDATVHFEFAAHSDAAETMPLKMITRDGQVLRPELPAADDIDAFQAEIDQMAQSVLTRQSAPRLSLDHATGAVELALDIQSQLIASRR
ncbi:MAG: Gfo/Idh/MocA family oxidoreductase [Planctomycetota bacterium]|jgi:predicted dehydrogenase|nr:Gfo/Idh/MocA family oxidoreductase [Planctomycetota bacterium]